MPHRPWPRELTEAFANMGTEIFETMFGPSSDFASLGMFETASSSTGYRHRGADLAAVGRFENVRPEPREMQGPGLRGSRLEFSSPVPTCRSSKSRRDSTAMREFPSRRTIFDPPGHVLPVVVTNRASLARA